MRVGDLVSSATFVGLLLLSISNNPVATFVDYQQHGCYFCRIPTTRLLLLSNSDNTVATSVDP